jgi:hypothetical protein
MHNLPLWDKQGGSNLQSRRTTKQGDEYQMTTKKEGEEGFIEILENAFGPQCGLNMDWANHAWLVHDIGGLGVNRGRGIYVYADDGNILLLLDVTFGAGEDGTNTMAVLAKIPNENASEMVAVANLAKTAQIENGKTHSSVGPGPVSVPPKPDFENLLLTVFGTLVRVAPAEYLKSDEFAELRAKVHAATPKAGQFNI